jgi:hypothetical protein
LFGGRGQTFNTEKRRTGKFISEHTAISQMPAAVSESMHRQRSSEPDFGIVNYINGIPVSI